MFLLTAEPGFVIYAQNGFIYYALINDGGVIDNLSDKLKPRKLFDKAVTEFSSVVTGLMAIPCIPIL